LAISRRLGVKSFHLLDNARDQAIRLGQWDWIAGELAAVLEDETDVLDRTTALTGTIIIRALRGKPVADLVAELEGIPMSEDDTVKPVALVEVGAWVAFAEGRFDLGRARSLDMYGLSYQNRKEARVFGARCALLAGDAAAAKEDVAAAEREGAFGRSSDDELMSIQAGIAALEGRSRDALGLYRGLLREWRDLGLVWDEALSAIDMATLLDPSDPEVSAAAEASRVILTSLGATPFLKRLDAAMARRPVRDGHAARIALADPVPEAAEARSSNSPNAG
jgi:hypothetical protein